MPRPTSIGDKQTKQLALLSANGVPVSRQYVIDSGTYDFWYSSRRGEATTGIKPSVFLHFENKGGQLGIPLPAGVVRVYAPDSSGAAQFVGEDAVRHTAKGEKVELRLGEAFDITADKTQIQYKVIGDKTRQATYRIEIRNAGDEAVTVHVREGLHGDWQILAESQPHTQENSNRIAWDVIVPGSGKTVLDYTALITW